MKDTNNNFKKLEQKLNKNFIGPKIIQNENWKQAYNNLIFGMPNLKLMKNNIYNDEGDKSSKKDNKNNKEIIFGEHRSHSFFEIYAREIIFQMFEYPLMSYRKYDLFIDKTNNNIFHDKSKIIEDGTMSSISFKKINIKDINIKIKEEYNKSDGEFSIKRKKIIIKKLKYNLKSNTENEKIRNQETKQNQIEKIKNNKLENNIEFKEKDSTKETSSNQIISKRKVKKLNHEKSKKLERIKSCQIINSSILMEFNKKEIKLNFIDNSDFDIKKIKYIQKENIKGDFDFLIHSINNNILEKVLTNKEISPFIFYGNFKFKKNKLYDIIGEIKESSESHYNLIEQANKYIRLIINLSKRKELNDKLGFNIKNKKILMYVFNGNYHRFIEDILDFEINRNKFKKMENYSNFECYNEIKKSFKNRNNKIKNRLLKSIIESGIPFIFIFIQNLIKLNTIKSEDSDVLNKKIDYLENKIKDFEERILKKEEDLKKLHQRIIINNNIINNYHLFINICIYIILIIIFFIVLIYNYY